MLTPHLFRGTIILQCDLINIRIIKNRSLVSKWRDTDYPSDFSPFYLYGTQDQQHIDHMLLKAPNAQLSSDNVDLVLDSQLSLSQLENGVLLYLNFFERSMQPFNAVNKPFFFTPGAEIEVEIYEDPFPPTAHGPGLAVSDEDSDNRGIRPMLIASGVIRLGESVFVDYDDLNKEDNRRDNSISSHSKPGVMSEQGKAGWRDMLYDRMQTSLSTDVGNETSNYAGQKRKEKENSVGEERVPLHLESCRKN